MEAYKNPNTPIECRVRDLISRMTLKEKIGQMAMPGKGSLTPTALRDGSVVADLLPPSLRDRREVRHFWAVVDPLR
ncbi:hypothetical protein CRG98_036502 [Punica granatum]|uniref:Uncharacterized protein n=1 Tax=Punica granatum TaxID=22663 RepID=A0A2I0IH76_PUNGR|nr:hypothetical protein CRG98_036502 [Punica granatum]